MTNPLESVQQLPASVRMPQKPFRPRSLLIVDDAMYLEIAESPEYVELLEDTGALIVPYSAAPESHKAEVLAIRELLVSTGQLVAGALLVKNPFDDDHYSFADDAVEVFASEKYHHLATVAKLLGATEVRFGQAKLERNVSAAEGGLGGRIPLLSVKANVKNDTTKKLEEQLRGAMTFDGSKPAIEEALDYVNRRHLTTDHQIRALITMRTGSNPIKSYQMSLSATKESDANLRSAAKIASKIPSKAIEIGANFARNAHAFRNIEITTEITF